MTQIFFYSMVTICCLLFAMTTLMSPRYTDAYVYKSWTREATSETLLARFHHAETIGIDNAIMYIELVEKSYPLTKGQFFIIVK